MPDTTLGKDSGAALKSNYESFEDRIGRMRDLFRNCFALSSQTAGTKYVARKKVTLELRIPEGDIVARKVRKNPGCYPAD